MAPDTQSTLDRYPLPRLLCFLEQKRFTGVLRLEEEGISREVLVSDGVPVALYPQTIQGLTRQLLEWGRLDTGQYTSLVSSLSAAREEEERALMDVAGVSAEELTKARRYLLFKELCRLFSLSRVPFVLSTEPDPRIQQHAQDAAIEPLFLVYNGIRNSYNESRLRDDLVGLEGHAIRLRSGAAELVERFGFGEDERCILDILGRGYQLLPDVLSSCGPSALPVLMVVYALWAAGGLEVAPEGSVTLAPPPEPRAQPALRPDASSSSPPPGGVGTEADLMEEANPSGRTNVAQIRLKAVATSSSPSRPGASVAFSQPAAAVPQPPGATGPATPKPRRATTRRKIKATTPMSGTFAAAKIPDMLLRKARLSASRLKASGDLKPDALDVLEELLDRLEDMEGQNPFEQLGLTPKARTADVKKAYMQLVRRLHPDRLSAMGLQELAEAADALFKRITQAHQTLSDPEKLEEARSICSGKAAAEDPDEARRAVEAEVNFQKGEVFFRKGDYAQAESYFRMAVEGNPSEGEHLALLAWTLYQAAPKGDRAARREDVQKMILRSLELSPRCARAHYYLGKLYLEEGLQDSAMESFRRATRVRDNYIEAMRELRLLTMRRERERSPKRSTLMEMLSLKKRKKT